MTSSMLRRQLKNLVQNYSEAEVKVREATSNDPWGPSSSQMADISDLTYNVVACNEIMTMLWKRLKDDKNWRHIHKSLTLLEYLLKTGDDRVLLKMKDNIYIVKALTEYRFVEKDGKDQGTNVREKAKVVLVLMEDDEKLKEEREFARKTREKTSTTSSASSSDTIKDPSYKPCYVPGASGLPSLDNIPSVADLTASFAARKEERLKQEAEKKDSERRAKMTDEELKWEDAGKGNGVKEDVWGREKEEAKTDQWEAPKEPEEATDPWGTPTKPDTTETSSDPWGGAAKTDEDPFAAPKTDEDPFAAPKNGEDPFAAPKGDPFGAPKDDPFAAPKDKPDPFSSSNSDPFNTPKDDPFSSTRNDPFNAPKDDPFNAPKDDPFSAPKDDPFSAPKDYPFSSPKDDPFNAPKDDPFNAPKDDPFNAPKDDPFNAPKDDPFNAPARTPPKEDPFSAPASTKDDPFTAPKTPPKDDPFTAPKTPPKDDPFAAPTTPPKDDPFAAPTTPPKDDPFAAPTTPPKDDPFAAPTTPPKDDPFAAPTTPPKDDPFAAPTTSPKDDPFLVQTTPPKGDPFAVVSSPPKDDASDPFSAPAVSSHQSSADAWEAPASSPLATGSDLWGTPSAPMETKGGNAWGDASSPVDNSDPFGDSSKPDNDPWGAPAAAPLSTDDAWGSPALPSDSSPSNDPFGDGAAKSSDPWSAQNNATSNGTGKRTVQEDMYKKTTSFLGSAGASLVDLDDLLSSNPKPKHHPLTNKHAAQTQADGMFKARGMTSGPAVRSGAGVSLSKASAQPGSVPSYGALSPTCGAASPSTETLLFQLPPYTMTGPQSGLNMLHAAQVPPPFSGTGIIHPISVRGNPQMGLNMSPACGRVVQSGAPLVNPVANPLLVGTGMGQFSFFGGNHQAGVAPLGGSISPAGGGVLLDPQLVSGSGLSKDGNKNTNPFLF